MNQNFKRFRLVDDDEMNSEKQISEYDPEIAAEARKRARIGTVLDDKTLNPELKLQLIRHLMHEPTPKSLVLTQPKVKAVPFQYDLPQMKTQLPTASTEPAHVREAGDGEQADPALEMGGEGEEEEHPENPERGTKFDTAVGMLPGPSQAKARELLGMIPSNFLDVNENDELIVQGNLIPHSNLTSTIRYLFNPGSSRDVPTGFNTVLQTLAKLKVPQRLISNKNARSFVSDMIQTGTGKRKLSKFHSLPRLTARSNPKKPLGFAKRPFNSLKLWKI